MILSSSDILRILGADAIIRQEAKLAVVEGRPGLGTDDTVYIYIEKYPTVEDFEATWKIWVQDNSGMGKYVLDAITSLLPNFDFKGQYYATTDFASDRTVVKSQEEIDREEFKDRFSGLQKGLEDRLSTVRDGRDGKDGRDGVDGLPGKDGRDGIDGRDGKDLVATEAELFDLQDVEQGIQMERGQVLTWDGTKWTNLYVRQTMSAGGAAGGGTSDVQVLNDLDDVTTEGVQNGQFLQYNSTADEWQPVTIAPGSGIEEAPQDGNYYVRQDGAWVNLEAALTALGIGGGGSSEIIDGGNFSGISPGATLEGGDFTSGQGGDSSFTLDAGDFGTGLSTASGDSTVDGGQIT